MKTITAGLAFFFGVAISVFARDAVSRSQRSMLQPEHEVAVKPAKFDESKYLTGDFGEILWDCLHDCRSDERLAHLCDSRGRGRRLVRSGHARNGAGSEGGRKDTVGAGDAFIAGLVVGLTNGTDTRKILENACRLGAFVASHYGATPLLTEEIKRLLFDLTK